MWEMNTWYMGTISTLFLLQQIMIRCIFTEPVELKGLVQGDFWMYSFGNLFRKWIEKLTFGCPLLFNLPSLKITLCQTLAITIKLLIILQPHQSRKSFCSQMLHLSNSSSLILHLDMNQLMTDFKMLKQMLICIEFSISLYYILVVHKVTCFKTLVWVEKKKIQGAEVDP